MDTSPVEDFGTDDPLVDVYDCEVPTSVGNETRDGSVAGSSGRRERVHG